VKTFRLTLALILALIGATGLCTAQSGSTTLDDLTARIEQSPSAALYAARAAERVKMGDAKNAIADFNRALEISPDDFSLHLARADQYAATGDPKSALADRDRAVHLKPDVAGTHLARADSYLQLGMRDEEMADRDETIRLAPDWPEAWLARGRSYFLRGEYSTALGDLNKVLDLKPDQAEARLLLVKTLEAIEKAEASAKAAPPVSEPQPSQPSASEPSSAEPVVSAAAPASAPTPFHKDAPPTAAPASAAVHHQRGRDLLNQSKYAEAIAELTEAIRLQPKFPLALNARGFAYYLTKKVPLALADFDQAILFDANYINAYQNRAKARTAAGDTQGAAEDNAKVHELTEKLARKAAK
jgi:tetratricopeptide (TPR) repeat protein